MTDSSFERVQGASWLLVVVGALLVVASALAIVVSGPGGSLYGVSTEVRAAHVLGGYVVSAAIVLGALIGAAVCFGFAAVVLALGVSGRREQEHDTIADEPDAGAGGP